MIHGQPINQLGNRSLTTSMITKNDMMGLIYRALVLNGI
jgi:hypothetical protein